MNWRDRCRPIVERVLAETADSTEKEQRAALRDAYPFGERKYWPYKVWLDEIAQQTGKRTKACKPHKQPLLDRERAARANPDQGKLF